MNLSTPRLELTPLSGGDRSFIFTLLNTRGWIENIGDRNIKSLADAAAYIQKMQQMPQARFYVVSTQEDSLLIGLITLIKRDYLAFHDIGFAFLEQYHARGYGYEATAKVVENFLKEADSEKIMGITLDSNHSSTRLLERLGLCLQEKINPEGTELLLYSGGRKEVLAAVTAPSSKY
ncbi:GNAT family N-acetyltransferase [Planobacterium oryzisoli]|uniref:GNAT family N-acetyltransferase n=1 Tax=Planobacterium oryzisoli TaxID=2771435 RepID=A0A930YV75_9FLAO|nr:GNAT family N-acetyltransferase [Planobacterium oryzisoli]MBF5026965.1 GNAT family N-acetyltransferase [Planobacterium oryzisoli]